MSSTLQDITIEKVRGPLCNVQVPKKGPFCCWNGGLVRLPSHLPSGQDLFWGKYCNSVCSPAFCWVLSWCIAENQRNVELEVILESLQIRKNEIQKKEVIYSSPNTPKMVGLELYLMAFIASKPNCCFGRSQNSEIHRNFQLYICYTVINRTLTIHAEGKHAVIQSLK